MSSLRLTALFVLIFVVYVNSQVRCPKCSNKYDPDSCNDDTQECGVEWNWCELHVHTADYYSLEYLCKNQSECTNHELYGCHPEENEICFYCCEDVVTCKIQRDDLFTYVFPTAGPPVTPPTAAPPTDAPIPGSTYPCPICTDPYNENSCAGTQNCDAENYDTCQLQVNPADNNKLGYTCQKFQECSNQESLGCNPSSNKVCTYCCLDPIACQHQRDYLFDFVFFPRPETLKPTILKD